MAFINDQFEWLSTVHRKMQILSSITLYEVEMSTNRCDI